MKIIINKFRIFCVKNIDLFALAITMLIVCGVNLRSPIQLSPDANLFINLSGLLIKENFNYIAFLKIAKEGGELFFYLVPISIMSLFRLFFNNTWRHHFKKNRFILFYSSIY